MGCSRKDAPALTLHFPHQLLASLQEGHSLLTKRFDPVVTILHDSRVVVRAICVGLLQSSEFCIDNANFVVGNLNQTLEAAVVCLALPTRLFGDARVRSEYFGQDASSSLALLRSGFRVHRPSSHCAIIVPPPGYLLGDFFPEIFHR